jgi:hypothetical protein
MKATADPDHRALPPRMDRAAADGNIRPGHPAERASWIWHPAKRGDETAFVRFHLDFDWPQDAPLRLHVTADQRYQLFLDDQPLGYGPDRCDPANWSVATLEIPLARGRHTLHALCWHLAEDPLASRMDPKHAGGEPAIPNPPMAQMSHRAGFLLCSCDGPAADLLDTGRAPWKAADLTDSTAMHGPENLGYHDIGPGFTIDMRVWTEPRTPARDAAVVARPPVFNIHGVRNPGRVLGATPLPEQRRERKSAGRIRAARPWESDNAPWSDGPAGGWHGLLEQAAAVTIPPHAAVEILWDFGQYECGYPELGWSGGRGARIGFEWAESLFIPRPGEVTDVDTPRGHRGGIDGKVWLGYGDAYISSGAANERPPALWWRAGRYARLRIRTGGEELRFEQLAIRTTGYPLERRWRWASSDAEWDAVMPLLARGLELCAHETWVDCPFYEQMMYVGDTVLHELSNHAGYGDERLSRRTLELFDQSRTGSPGGLVAERYPCGWRQESATYAMLWPQMVRNHLLWRGDESFIRERLTGVRQLLESLLALRNADGLLGTVPGWPFIDWVSTWHQGCGPGVREGDSSIVNLHLVLALQAAAEIEHALGEEIMRRRYLDHAASLFGKMMARYWDGERGLLRDTSGAAPTSEHAQILALLTGLAGAERDAACMRFLLHGGPDARCTIYFSFYLLEALARFGEADAFFARLGFWRDLARQGFTSLPEMPDPCRSDCHGWGAHPLYHTLASIAGVRPAAPGMARVRIAPMPGPLDHFSATVVHPRGEVNVAFKRQGGRAVFETALPAGVAGELVWNNQVHPLTGRMVIEA